ncbi:hypothetical protein KSP39_PZI007494 [Platanthera zijinensis]|uniref:Uncharacterized protein n=1 Tax=Platanthera zijinensis TaxID=2320716 RepID=A0AAP0G9S6_9ASPA
MFRALLFSSNALSLLFYASAFRALLFSSNALSLLFYASVFPALLSGFLFTRTHHLNLEILDKETSETSNDSFSTALHGLFNILSVGISTETSETSDSFFTPLHRLFNVLPDESSLDVSTPPRSSIRNFNADSQNSRLGIYKLFFNSWGRYSKSTKFKCSVKCIATPLIKKITSTVAMMYFTWIFKES